MLDDRGIHLRRGVTLVELLTVVFIVAILATVSLAVFSKLRARAQRAQCVANLQNLYIAAELYLQQNESWPQIRIPPDTGSDYANAWIDALKPFGPTSKTWICPTVQELLANPDYSDPTNARIDYIATPFDDKPGTPHKWPRQPWFVETGDVHGHGNLIIFTDGSISDLKTVIGATARP